MRTDQARYFPVRYNHTGTVSIRLNNEAHFKHNKHVMKEKEQGAMFCQGPSAPFLIGKGSQTKMQALLRLPSQRCVQLIAVISRGPMADASRPFSKISSGTIMWSAFATSPFTGTPPSQSLIHLVIWHFSLTTGRTPLDAQTTSPHHTSFGLET